MLKWDEWTALRTRRPWMSALDLWRSIQYERRMDVADILIGRPRRHEVRRLAAASFLDGAEFPFRGETYRVKTATPESSWYWDRDDYKIERSSTYRERRSQECFPLRTRGGYAGECVRLTMTEQEDYEGRLKFTKDGKAECRRKAIEARVSTVKEAAGENSMTEYYLEGPDGPAGSFYTVSDDASMDELTDEIMDMLRSELR